MRVQNGEIISEGIAIAKAYIYTPSDVTVEEGYFVEEKRQENIQAFRLALQETKNRLKEFEMQIEKDDKETALIFAAHQMILESESLRGEIESSIWDKCMNPDYAVEVCFQKYIQTFKDIKDPLIAGRENDIIDVKNRLIRAYREKEIQDFLQLEEDVIVVARELLPSDVIILNQPHLKGIITEKQGLNAHAAIMLRSLEIPSVTGIENVKNEIEHNTLIGLDALNGEVYINPCEEIQTHLLEEKQAYLRKKQSHEKFINESIQHKDGSKIWIGINVDSTDFSYSKEHYDFVGLLRTEFLYMDKTKLPSEEEQLSAYREVLDNAHGRMVTLRTLDLSGEKQLPYVEMPKENNPALGNVGIRFGFKEPEILLTQLRAALRASSYGPIQILFPMVSSLEDIYCAKEMVEKAKKQLREKRLEFNDAIPIGVMIETPAVALIADLVAEEVDFASIGTNDLAQYVCAADRMNQDVSRYYHNDSIAMQRLLKFVIRSFAEKNKPLSVCGEMAGEPNGAVALVNMGIRHLSMDARKLAMIKAELLKEI